MTDEVGVGVDKGPLAPRSAPSRLALDELHMLVMLSATIATEIMKIDFPRRYLGQRVRGTARERNDAPAKTDEAYSRASTVYV